MNRMPVARHRNRLPPTVVAPRAPCTAQAARSRAPTLPAASPADAKRSSSGSVRPTPTAPSTRPRWRGPLPAARTRASAARATSRPCRPGSRWERSVVSGASAPGPPSPERGGDLLGQHRCERDRVAPSPLGAPASWLARARRGRHSIAPILATARAASIKPEADSAEQVPRRERVTGAGRVHRAHLRRGVGDPPIRTPRGPSFTTISLPGTSPTRSACPPCRSDHAASARPAASGSGPRLVSQRRRGGRSTLGRGSRPAAAGQPLDRLAQQAVTGQVQPGAAVEPGVHQMTGGQFGAHAPVGQHGPGPAAVGEREHDAGPPWEDGPASSTAGRRVPPPPCGPRIGRPRRAQAGPAAQRGDPRGHVRRLPPAPAEVTAGVSVSGSTGPASNTIRSGVLPQDADHRVTAASMPPVFALRACGAVRVSSPVPLMRSSRMPARLRE